MGTAVNVASQRAHFVHDALIIGAGPAGVSCAVWLANLGLHPLVLDAAPSVGGLCRGNPFPDPWTVLVPHADGNAIAEQLSRSIAESRAQLRLNTAVERIRLCGAHAPARFVAVCATGDVVHGSSVVLATGVRARGKELAAHPDDGTPLPGILVGPGGDVAGQDYAGKRVAILGGGDNAFENALYASRRGAACVTLYARSVHAQQQFRDQIPPESIRRGRHVIDPVARRVNGEAYDLILVFYGWEPALDPVMDLPLALDAGGFVDTDRYTAQTSAEGIYAVGEVTRRQHPCVLTAMADGVVAAKAIQARLERRPA